MRGAVEEECAGIGCDIARIARFAAHEEGLARRIFTAQETEHFSALPAKRRLSFLAGHFAAREAVIKALPVPAGLSSIALIPDEGGKWKAVLPDKEAYGRFHLEISISHDGEYAMAAAACFVRSRKPEMPGSEGRNNPALSEAEKEKTT